MRKVLIISFILFILSACDGFIVENVFKSEESIEYYKKAVEFQKNEQYQEAIKQYTKSLIDSPKNDLVYGNRGLCKKELGDTQGAISDINKAIEYSQDEIMINHYKWNIDLIEKND